MIDFSHSKVASLKDNKIRINQYLHTLSIDKHFEFKCAFSQKKTQFFQNIPEFSIAHKKNIVFENVLIRPPHLLVFQHNTIVIIKKLSSPFERLSFFTL